jgi:hypothetical protein
MTRRKTFASWILAAGFAVALVIFVTASPPEDSPEGAEATKQYLRQMEMYGGSANVLATEFREWWGGLWHGRELAYTVAVLSVLLAGVVFVHLTPLPDVDPDRCAGPGEEGGTRE